MPTTLSDGKKTKQFPLNPERVKMSIAGDYAINSVLDTDKPHVRRKSSAKVYKLDRILLMSFSGSVDQQPLITTLQYWASQQTKLRFVSDSYTCPSCYIKSMELEIKEWRGKKVLSAEMSMELIEANPNTIKATSVNAANNLKRKPTKQITPREQNNYVATITALLKKNPSKFKQIGLRGNSFKVKVDDNKKVTIESAGIFTTYQYDDLVKRLK